MERQEFREAVFARDSWRCVNCGSPAVDAHHLMERRLWDDGGYHLDNGVSLCSECHLLAEQTILSPDGLREKAGITRALLPPHLSGQDRYDKWGNVYLENGLRAPGELFWDESVQKIIKGDFAKHVKYPRTPHLPWSPGYMSDDYVLDRVEHLEGKLLLLTEKMDGENTTMYSDHIHARSLDSGYHLSRTWVQNLHAQIAWEIPSGWRIVGENVFAKHAILYDRLPSYFLVHSIWTEKNYCLEWRETVAYADALGLTVITPSWSGYLVPGQLDEQIRYFESFDSRYGDQREGYVLRTMDGFPQRDFRKSVAKWVRPGHVTADTQNWRAKQVIRNGLEKDRS